MVAIKRHILGGKNDLNAEAEIGGDSRNLGHKECGYSRKVFP